MCWNVMERATGIETAPRLPHNVMTACDFWLLLAAAVKLTVVADENLTVGSGRLPAASVAPGR
jgi:hypothetical protein